MRRTLLIPPRRKMKFLRASVSVLLTIIIAALVFSCGDWFPETSVSPPQGASNAPNKLYPEGGGSNKVSQWTENEGTWYQIFTCLFYDSDGDGIGDIPGIIYQLDYLNDTGTDAHNQAIADHGECNNSLHIDGIWLTPIMTADSYHKYDTTDYLEVDPEFGTMNDVRDLLRQCHERGVKLILDLAVNHTSPNHPWFQKALEEWRSGALGKYATYYNIRAAWNRPNEISSHWFTSFSDWGDPWPGDTGQTPDGRQLFYYGAFGPWMPDLNWDSTALKQEFEQILEFWLSDVGIDGWRLDATKHIYEVGEWTGDNDRNVAFWTWFADTCRKYNPNVYMVGECLADEGTVLYYHKPGMSSFAPFFGERIGSAVLNGRGTYFSEGVLWWTREVKNQSPYATGSPFLSNHDENRSSNWLSTDENRKMAASLLLLYPGTPFMYYGEEISLRGYKVGKIPDESPDDKYVRGPMIFSWDFSENAPGQPLPSGGWYAPNDINQYGDWRNEWRNGRHGQPAYGGGVEQQLQNENSLLRHYIKIQNLKHKYPWIAWGKTDDVGIDPDQRGWVGAYRVTDDNPKSDTFGKSVVIAHNAFIGYIGAPDGYIQVPDATGYDYVYVWGDIDPVEYDSALNAYWLKPYCTVIFREYED